MAFAYLLDPNQQHIDRGGSPNVHGYFKVFLAGTDDIATTYKDFSGTLNPENIPIDLNGRCVIIADSTRQYRVEMYWPNGGLVYTQEPVWTLSGGGGGTSIVEVTSTDGTITVDKSTVGSRTTFDLGVNNEDDPEELDWIKCAGSTLVDGIYVPQKSDGSMDVGTKGVELEADMLYHAVVSITASKNIQRMAYYDKISVGLALFDGEATTPVTAASRIVDYSCALSQEFEVCTDIKVGPVPAQLVITVNGQDVQGGVFAISRLDVHRVSSHVAEGSGSFTQVQSDWAQTNSSAVSFIKNKPDLSGFATQTELTQGLAGKQDTISDLATIRSGAAEGATAVQPSDLATVATSGSYNDLLDKPSIPAAQVNSDWNASSGVAEILNKPQLSTVATTGDYSDLSNKPSIPAAQVNSDWNAVSGVSEILNKPSIPTATSDLNNDSGFITASDIPAQVNADWNSSSGVSEILNKPAIPVVDQTYDGTSANAQSGIAVASALAGVGVLPSSTSADAGKVLTVNSSGNAAWETPATPSGGGSDVWWTENPADPSLNNGECHLQFKDTSYDPRNDPDATFLAKFSSITQVSAGIYDFVLADPSLSSSVFENKYTGSNEFVIVAVEFSSGTHASLFKGCTGLRAVYNLHTGGYVQLVGMFMGCTSLREVHGGTLLGSASGSSLASLFRDCTALKTVDVPYFAAASVSGMFQDCTSLEHAPALTAAATGSAMDASSLFSGCASLRSVSWYSPGGAPSYTGACDYSYMFYGCKALQSVMPLAEFFLRQKASNMTGMFYGCTSLTEVPYIRVNAYGASAQNMFRTCHALKAPPALDWENVTDARFMFEECRALMDMASANVAGSPWYDVITASNISSMFEGCMSVYSGMLAAYNGLAANTNVSTHPDTFYKCGVVWPNAELAQIPSSWGGTGA